MNLPRLILPVLALGVAVFLSGCLSSQGRGLDGIEFESRSGQDTTGEGLPWIERNPVRWSMTTIDGRYTAVISPPCAAINAPVKITSEEIVVNLNRAGIAAITCNERTMSMDTWVKNLIAQPLDYTWDGETLRLAPH